MEISGVSVSLAEYYAELAKLRARNASNGSAAELFGKVDADGGKSVDAGEFAALFSQAAAATTAENNTGDAGSRDSARPFPGMSAAEMESLFAEADSDGDGALSFEEFTALRGKLFPPSPGDEEEAAEMELLFAGADSDGDGILSLEEFTALRDKLHASATAGENQRDAADLLSPLNNFSNFESLFAANDESSSNSLFAELLKNYGTSAAGSSSAVIGYAQELIQKVYGA